jgi:type III restriction enzyme
MASADNPILNSPYAEPARHYATDAKGNLNYRDIRPGRRIFTPDVPQVPIGQQNQGSVFDVNDFPAQYGEHLINRLRDELRTWRQAGYHGVNSRVTRELLTYWFANPERAAHQKLFFAQQEAVEAAVWLNEVAEKSNTGTSLQSQLRQRQATASDDPAGHLPRLAFKMATGSGKTVVMACLILYHYLNRREAAYRPAHPRNHRLQPGQGSQALGGARTLAAGGQQHLPQAWAAAVVLRGDRRHRRPQAGAEPGHPAHRRRDRCRARQPG